jgi:hypothetical protein
LYMAAQKNVCTRNWLDFRGFLQKRYPKQQFKAHLQKLLAQITTIPKTKSKHTAHDGFPKLVELITSSRFLM